MTSIFPEPDIFVAGSGEPQLRWGVLAPGNIASAFVKAAHKHTTQRFVAAASRSAERAREFTERFGIARAYGGYEHLVADPDVDVVYVAAPASEHLELGMLAIQAGKNVVIEKPLATNASDARQLTEAARAAGVFLMEALWSRYFPQASVIRKLVADGVLGEVRSVFADFGMAGNPDPSHRLHRPDLGGGALLDLGIYPIQFSSMVLGPPTEVVSMGVLEKTGVDAMSTSFLRHATGAQATVLTSIGERTPSRAYIAGAEGRIELDGPFHIPGGLTFGVNDFLSAPQRWDDPTGVTMMDGLSWEATAAARYIGEARSESPLHTHAETVQILGTIDEIRDQLQRAGVTR